MMAVDTRQQPPFSSMGYDSMRYPPPHFTNPWVSAPNASQSHLYATPLPSTSVDSKPHYSSHLPNVSSAYSAGHVSASPMASGIPSLDPETYNQSSLPYSQEALSVPRPYGAPYHATSAPSASTFAPTSAPQYPSDILQRSTPYGYQSDRRTHSLSNASESERSSYNDALDASRGMVQMSQTDITPRNIYGNQGSIRSSSDSYGFPTTHSAHSSISSASTYPTYYNSSVSEASTGDYSSAGESVDIPGSRSLPRPNGLIGGQMPPAPQSMMGQFSSKVSSSSQKKHKCKICDKRFTRPSSLQTHMYSHTGEKPFACDVDGCGRHFSVVSNLRRHRKVHKGDGRDAPSPDDDED